MSAYFLQPRNATQALEANWYNPTYRRTGAYKGLGRYRGLGQTSLDQVLSLPTQTVINTPAAPFEYVLQDAPQSINPVTGQVSWTGSNTLDLTSFLPWILGGGLLIFLVMEVSGKRR
jgi:hypothetical protein